MRLFFESLSEIMPLMNNANPNKTPHPKNNRTFVSELIVCAKPYPPTAKIRTPISLSCVRFVSMFMMVCGLIFFIYAFTGKLSCSFASSSLCFHFWVPACVPPSDRSFSLL